MNRRQKKKQTKKLLKTEFEFYSELNNKKTNSSLNYFPLNIGKAKGLFHGRKIIG